MLTLGVIGWIVIGGLAGWIGSKIMKTDGQMGLVLNVVVGIVGGLLGGFLLRGFGVDVAGGGHFGLGSRVGGVVRRVDAQRTVAGVAVAVSAKAGLEPGGCRPAGQPGCCLRPVLSLP